MFIYGSSKKNLYKENEPGSFRINLGTILELEGEWEMALLDIDLPLLEKGYRPLYLTLFSNICSSSILEASQKPVFYRIYRSDFKPRKVLKITTPRYVPLNVNSLQTVNMYMLDEKGQKPSFQSGQVNCTLHLRKKNDLS